MTNTEIGLSKRVYDSVTGSAHTLIAGTTGSGKSVLLNTLICFMHSHRFGKFIFFDLKRVELRQYKDLDFCADYITEPEDVIRSLDKVIRSMEKRFQRMTGKQSTEIPLVIIIDELGDMITQKGVLERLVKIGRLGRAANIHLICATQDPSRRTLPAALMQNFTCCIALRCRSSIESRQIIGIPGAELLPKHGKAYMWNADGISNFDVPYMSEEWVEEYTKIQPKKYA